MSRASNIEMQIRAALNPTRLEVEDESSSHSVPEGAQTHFRVLVVSEEFVGQALLARHRRIHAAVAAEFKAGLHALAIAAYTEVEWQARLARSEGAPQSPDCLGGSRPT